MKKIIAVAVASAFALPAFAADVSLTGDVEYAFAKYESDGVSGITGDADFTITASDEVGGVSITAYIENEQGTQDGAISLSGSFGTVKIGDDSFSAAESIDEVAGIAEFELGDSAIAATTAEALTAQWTLPTMVDGLTIHASYGAGAGSNNLLDTDEYVVTSYAVSYTTGMVTVGYGSIDDEQTPTFDSTVTNVSLSTGPIFVGYEVTTNDGALNTDISALGLSYDYGQGKVFVESQTTDTNGTETNDSGVGVSYTLGAVNMYIQSNSGDTVADNGKFVGVEYAF
jgi:hypothetical protein